MEIFHDREIFQDMEIILDTEIMLDMDFLWILKLNIMHYIVQPSVKEKNYVIGHIKYVLMYFINSC